MYSMWEKCVQILYSSINNSKICPKWAQTMDSIGRIRTAYLLCTRITLETTALQVSLTTWILRTCSMWEKCVQILYSLINNLKIYPKLIKPIDRMDRIWTAYLLGTRITLETTALRVTWSEAREGPVFFQKSKCMFSGVSEVPRGFLKFMKNSDFSPRLGPKIVHESNPLITPYAAHILWTFMTF